MRILSTVAGIGLLLVCGLPEGDSPTEGEVQAFLRVLLPELQKCLFADS